MLNNLSYFWQQDNHTKNLQCSIYFQGSQWIGLIIWRACPCLHALSLINYIMLYTFHQSLTSQHRDLMLIYKIFFSSYSTISWPLPIHHVHLLCDKLFLTQVSTSPSNCHFQHLLLFLIHWTLLPPPHPAKKILRMKNRIFADTRYSY